MKCMKFEDLEFVTVVVLRHIAGGRRVMRDEDADIDTAAGPTAAATAAGVCNVDDDLLLNAARSRRVARPSPVTYVTADAGDTHLS